MYLIQNYNYNENGSYVTVTDTKEKALKIANDYIDKWLEDEANIPSEELTKEEDSEGNFLDRENGRLNLEEICSVEIYPLKLDKELETRLGGEIL